MTEEHDLKRLARDLIDEQSTMALATAREGEAWAAPVYYVYFEKGFWFFSAPDSRHIQEALESGRASAAVYPFVDSWREIRGIQMSGRVRKVKPGLGALKAVRAYVSRYPFIRELFDPGQELDLEAFGKRFRVRFYRFEPDLVYYMDNRIRFGFREAVRL
ncbi:MAG: pyridoxamine 5'-phosphate oxidase family protein [Deltaproteobacteria bacterium]|nr:pyridoxamine 5'-phosphate oxidase family protein [Deltaproteobacteria bacterium]